MTHSRPSPCPVLRDPLVSLPGQLPLSPLPFHRLPVAVPPSPRCQSWSRSGCLRPRSAPGTEPGRHREGSGAWGRSRGRPGGSRLGRDHPALTAPGAPNGPGFARACHSRGTHLPPRTPSPRGSLVMFRPAPVSSPVGKAPARPTVSPGKVGIGGSEVWQGRVWAQDSLSPDPSAALSHGWGCFWCVPGAQLPSTSLCWGQGGLKPWHAVEGIMPACHVPAPGTTGTTHPPGEQAVPRADHRAPQNHLELEPPRPACGLGCLSHCWEGLV